jgi:NitT/TauT family transport system substrate-binding protein
MQRFAFLLIVLSLALTACAGAAPATPTPPPLTQTSLQLSWVHEYSSSPFHVAVREGLFAANGIDARLDVGGFGENGFIDPIQTVLDGQAEFGMASSQDLINALAAGKPVVAVANLLQRSPLALMLTDPTVQTPNDLVGLTLTAADGGARTALESFLTSQGVALDSVNIVSRTDFGVEPLTSGAVDGLVAWRINEGVSLEEQGIEPVVFLFSDYGIDNYEFVLFTTRERVEQNPALVQAVVNTVQSAVEATAADPAKAIEHTRSFAPDLDVQAQRLRLEATILLMRSADRTFRVTMTPEVWQTTYQALLAEGRLAEGLDVTQAYTNQFAEAAAND